MIRFVKFAQKVNHRSACRIYCSSSSDYKPLTASKVGIVIGVLPGRGEDFTLTCCGQKYDSGINGELTKALKNSGPPKPGSARIYWNLSKNYLGTAVVTIPKACTYSRLENIDAPKEIVRIAAAAGTRALQAEDFGEIRVEDFDDAENAAIGAFLGAYHFDEFKSKKKRTPPVIHLAKESEVDKKDWCHGVCLAQSQNFGRTLMETPANYMTPTIFAETVTQKLSKVGVQCTTRDKSWIEEKKMESFLSVSHGSDEPPVLLELEYSGGSPDDKPICFVGKGVTFDSGGLSIKPAANMGLMRADMGGAAMVASAIHAIAALKLPVNVVGITPLTENVIGPKATKPADIVTAMNGKTISVDNTDAEGRLILADALCYSAEFNPKYVISIATLTGSIIETLGHCACGAFCNDDRLWRLLESAGFTSGDRVWRMPLFRHYVKMISGSEAFDLVNVAAKAGSCTAAAFLSEFIPKNTPWAHLDMATHLESSHDQPYTAGKAMPGRPMRTLVELVSNYVA